MHLYSWIASGAIQVTTHPYKVADLHLRTFNLHLTPAFVFAAKYVFGVEGGACDRLHLSTCLSVTNIYKRKRWSGLNFAFHMVVLRRMKHIDNGGLCDPPSSAAIRLTFWFQIICSLTLSDKHTITAVHITVSNTKKYIDFCEPITFPMAMSPGQALATLWQ